MAKEETKVASENEENEVAERQAAQTESENMEPDAVSDNKTLKVGRWLPGSIKLISF